MSKFEHVLDDESIGLTHVYFASVQVSLTCAQSLLFWSLLSISYILL